MCPCKVEEHGHYCIPCQDPMFVPNYWIHKTPPKFIHLRMFWMKYRNVRCFFCVTHLWIFFSRVISFLFFTFLPLSFFGVLGKENKLVWTLYTPDRKSHICGLFALKKGFEKRCTLCWDQCCLPTPKISRNWVFENNSGMVN